MLALPCLLASAEDEYGLKRPIEIRKVLIPYARKKSVKIVPVDDRAEYDAKSKELDDKTKDGIKNAEARHALEVLLESYESLFIDNYLTKSIY